MAKFCDNEGREWQLNMNVATMKRVKQLTDVDLGDIFGKGEKIEKLFGDIITVADVIYAIIKPEADERKVSDEDFGRALAGDAFEKAVAALLESIIDFCPSHLQTTIRAKMATENSSPETSTTSAMNSVESLESTRPVTHFEN